MARLATLSELREWESALAQVIVHHISKPNGEDASQFKHATETWEIIHAWRVEAELYEIEKRKEQQQ